MRNLFGYFIKKLRMCVTDGSEYLVFKMAEIVDLLSVQITCRPFCFAEYSVASFIAKASAVWFQKAVDYW